MKIHIYSQNVFLSVVVLLTFAISKGELSAQDMIFPETSWQHAFPESEKVDSEELEMAVSWFERNVPFDGVKRLIIVRNGRVIWQGPEVEQRQRVWSVTKTFTGTAHGLLDDDGKCSLDTRAKNFCPVLTEYYPDVTLRHLATMTSGYDGVGGTYNCNAEGRCDDNSLVDPLPPLFEPGTKYQYWDEALQQYGFVLTKIAGEPLDGLLKKRILKPIGIQKIAWQLDYTGKVLNWTGGLEISTSDLARFGLLFLNRGGWGGKQLLSAEWVDAATTVQVPPSIPNAHPTSTQGSGTYGFLWWPNGTRRDGTCRWPDAPQGTYACCGYNNNDMFVLPAWNMVIVRLGLDQGERHGGFSITDATYNEFIKRIGNAILDPVVEGNQQVWNPLTISFRGPVASETESNPNPFLDYRLQVMFIGPSGQQYNVPGFFDGDGHGGSKGSVWRVRFSPDEPGTWRYETSFRQGNQVAVNLEPNEGIPVAFDGTTGYIDIYHSNPNTPDFLKWGRLLYAGGHYLKFKDGPYWIRGGTDSPENLLAFEGFDNTIPSHCYAEHEEDWRPGDPDWGKGKGQAIIGAINYLASKHVNSIYFLTMNVGGDGCDVWPWVEVKHPAGSVENDNLHFDISKLRQWETVFNHAQQHSIFLHFVLNEAEEANKRELDNGELGVERKLYYRELIARFGHYLALQWNLCEEYDLYFDLGYERIRRFADYIKRVDPYDHPITIHSDNDALEALRFTFGDERFSMTSIQLSQKKIDLLTEQLREATTKAGRPLPISMDEFTIASGQEQDWVPVDNAQRWRKEKLWPTYLSGGNIEFILGDLLETESFKTSDRDKLWDYVWYARRFLEELPFNEMKPNDKLMSGAGTIEITQNLEKAHYTIGAQVFAKPDEVYAIYLPTASSTGLLDLSHVMGFFQLLWFNPRLGRFEGSAKQVKAGSYIPLGTPPTDVDEDWVVLLKR